MKKILLIAFSFSMLCFAAAEISAGVQQKVSVPETVRELTQKAAQVTIIESDESVVVPDESTGKPGAAQIKEMDIKQVESKTDEINALQSQPSKAVIEYSPLENSPAVTVDPIPEVVSYAKTGYDGEDDIPVVAPSPVSAEKADIGVAMRVANEYAVTKYGINIDTSLNLDNSAYRFPAAVPVTVSQETLNAKAIDMVEYTFQQLMRVDKLTLQDFSDLGFRCSVFTYESNGEFLTYVFYDA